MFSIAVVANESETVRISNRSVNISIRVNCGYLVATWSWPPTGCWIIVVRIVPSSPTFTRTSITLLDIFEIQNFYFFYFFFFEQYLSFIKEKIDSENKFYLCNIEWNIIYVSLIKSLLQKNHCGILIFDEPINKYWIVYKYDVR